MEIEIIAIGDEILFGNVVNTNASFLSRELKKLGYKVSEHKAISDDEKKIKQSIELALKDFDLVIMTGGLGPTFDDKTKKVASSFFGMELQKDETLANDLYSRFEKNKYKTEQALVPKGAIVLKNSIGTAPGLIFEKEAKSLILLPGVPHEMEQMFYEYLIKYLLDRFKLKKKIFQTNVNICLKKEDDVEPLLERLRKMDKSVDIGIYPSFATLRVSFAVEGQDEKEALNKILPLKKILEKEFEKYIFPSEYDTIQEAIRDIFISKKKTLALAESCTGGAVASSLTCLCNASLFLLGSVVSYSNEFKEDILKVSKNTLKDKGAVSNETVEEMVEGLFKITKADFSLAISGIAGPGGGSEKKPVGMVCFAIGQRGKKIDSGTIHLSGDRAFIIKYSVGFALSLLWVKINHNLTYFSK